MNYRQRHCKLSTDLDCLQMYQRKRQFELSVKVFGTLICIQFIDCKFIINIMCCQIIIIFCTIILYEMLASVRVKNMNFHKNPQAIDNFYRTVLDSFVITLYALTSIMLSMCHWISNIFLIMYP